MYVQGTSVGPLSREAARLASKKSTTRTHGIAMPTVEVEGYVAS